MSSKRQEKAAPYHVNAPYARAARLTAIRAFVTKPFLVGFGFVAEDSTSPEVLGGRHITHALRAQHHAIQSEHARAAREMERALGFIESGIKECEAAGQVALYKLRHWQLLAALARSFERSEALRARERPAIEALSSDPATPLLPYLEEQRAADFSYTHEYSDALAALALAKLNGAPLSRAAEIGLADRAARYSIEPADDATRQVSESKPEEYQRWKSLLDRAECEFLKPALERLEAFLNADEAAAGCSDEERNQAKGWLDLLLYWQGRAALVLLRCAPEEEIDTLAKLAIARFDRWALRKPDGNQAKHAESWRKESHRLWAIRGAKCGQAKAVYGQLKQVGSPAAELLRDGFSWRGLAEGFMKDRSAETTSLLQSAANWLDEHRGQGSGHGNVERPSKTPHRLAIQLPVSLLRPSGQRVAGDAFIGKPEDTKPSLGWVRSYLKGRLGFTLPGVQIWEDETAKQVVALIDNIPIGYLASKPNERHALSEGASGTSWPLPEVIPASKEATDPEPSKGEISEDQYVAAWFAQQILHALPELADSATADDLGLGEHPPQKVLPLLRLLLADRTPLLERKALQELAAGVSAGRLTALQAAEAYRRIPAVRASLWGVEKLERSEWTNIKLDKELEERLASCVKDPQHIAITVPDELRKHISKAVEGKPGGAPKDVSPMGARMNAERPAQAASESGKNAALPPASKGPSRRLVVDKPELRPWLSALLRQLGIRGIPVVTARELSS